MYIIYVTFYKIDVYTDKATRCVIGIAGGMGGGQTVETLSSLHAASQPGSQPGSHFASQSASRPASQPSEKGQI